MELLPIAFELGLPLSQWVWQNRNRLPGLLDGAGDIASTIVENGGLAVHRVGSAIVFGDDQGGQRVLAFLESTGSQLDSLQSTLNGVVAGQTAIGASLGYLQQLSMLTLGVSMVSPIVLVTQNVGLSKQLKALTQLVTEIKDILTTEQVARLNTGLGQLDVVITKEGRHEHRLGMLNHAQQNLALAAESYAISVRQAIEAKKPHDVVRLLNRHLAVATCGVARCHVQMEDDETACKELDTRSQTLQDATRYIFQRTAGRDPERFLVPQLQEKVTLAGLVEVFELAHLAGVLDEDEEVQAQLTKNRNAATLFESLRGRLFKGSWWPFGPALDVLTAEVHAALGCVEEFNRVVGLRKFLDEVIKRKQPAAQVLTEVEACRMRFSQTGDPFLSWCMA